MNVPTPTEIAVDLARENERLQIRIAQLNEKLNELIGENVRLKQELAQQTK